MFSIWRAVSVVASLGICAVVGTSVHAEDYPSHTVRFLIPSSPGGGNDTMTRPLAQKLSEKWGQPVVPENRPGADGILAAQMLASAPADGYTIMLVDDRHTITPLTHQLTYDPLKSFAPVIMFGERPEVFVVNPKNVDVKSLTEFISLAKSKPGQLNFGAAGQASVQYLSTQLLMKRTGITMAFVNYKGSSDATVALLGGEIQMAVGAIGQFASLVRSGELRALAVSSLTRSSVLPEVPTIAEATGLSDIEDMSGWTGVMVRAGTPKEIIAKIHDDIAEAIKSPDYQKLMDAQGYAPVQDPSSEGFGKKMAGDIERWTAVHKDIAAQ